MKCSSPKYKYDIYNQLGLSTLHLVLEFDRLVICKRADHVGSAIDGTEVFTRSSNRILGSNPTRSIGVCVLSVFILSCVRSGIATA
jgi:hypothetical protein